MTKTVTSPWGSIVGRCPSTTACATVSSWRPKVRPTVLMSSGSGSCRPSHTNEPRRRARGYAPVKCTWPASRRPEVYRAQSTTAAGFGCRVPAMAVRCRTPPASRCMILPSIVAAPPLLWGTAATVRGEFYRQARLRRRLRGHPGVELREGTGEQPRDVHLGDADLLRDLGLRLVAVEAQGQDALLT